MQHSLYNKWNINSYTGIKSTDLFYKNVINSSLMFTAMYLQGSSSHLCFASAMMASQWPSHNEIRGEKSRHEIKVSSSGSHISSASKSRCPGLSGVSLYCSTAGQPWISVVLHQQRHLPGICNAMSCTCCALCPDAGRHCKTCREFSHLTLFWSVNSGFLLSWLSYQYISPTHLCCYLPMKRFSE